MKPGRNEIRKMMFSLSCVIKLARNARLRHCYSVLSGFPLSVQNYCEHRCLCYCVWRRIMYSSCWDNISHTHMQTPTHSYSQGNWNLHIHKSKESQINIHNESTKNNTYIYLYLHVICVVLEAGYQFIHIKSIKQTNKQKKSKLEITICEYSFL